MKDLRIRSVWIRMSPKSNVFRREKEIETQTWRRRPCEDRGKDCSDAPRSQRLPADARGLKRQRRSLPSSFQRKLNTAKTLISGF